MANETTHNRSAVTGQFITEEKAAKNPRESVRETDSSKSKKDKR
jgi:hypothetical protein